MAKREDIRKILIIGSGPIIIGQACEFDYSGTQACKALRAEGYDVVLVNSNPATIMTDPGMADHTYIEPLTVERITAVIEKERPDALLPNLGGQTALNLASKLHGGRNPETVRRGSHRRGPGSHRPRRETASSSRKPWIRSACRGQIRTGLYRGGSGKGGRPARLSRRPPPRLHDGRHRRRHRVQRGGTAPGGSRGLATSLINQVLVEECVLGWEELELEVVRDAKGQKITVCFIENVDPMGVHTGDTLRGSHADRSAGRAGQASGLLLPHSGRHRRDGRQRTCSLPTTGRTTASSSLRSTPHVRSSALASKATGFPIASVSTKLASGITMDELPYWRKGSLEKYEPYGDYVVVKFARWAFEKFPKASDKLGTQMKAVGEVMSIGQNFKEAFQKAVRSLEIGRAGLGAWKKLEASPRRNCVKRSLMAAASASSRFTNSCAAASPWRKS